LDGHADRLEKARASGHRIRLRKRLLDAGPAGFHDYELIEYLLALTIPRGWARCARQFQFADPTQRPTHAELRVRLVADSNPI